jgi:hypothetical protein
MRVCGSGRPSASSLNRGLRTTGAIQRVRLVVEGDAAIMVNWELGRHGLESRKVDAAQYSVSHSRTAAVKSVAVSTPALK